VPEGHEAMHVDPKATKPDEQPVQVLELLHEVQELSKV